MCAIVPSMPVVLIMPLTDLSAAILKVPVPDADVVTGGVSSVPVKCTLTSPASANPLLANSAAAAITARTPGILKSLVMAKSFGLCVEPRGRDALDVRSYCPASCCLAHGVDHHANPLAASNRLAAPVPLALICC